MSPPSRAPPEGNPSGGAPYQGFLTQVVDLSKGCSPQGGTLPWGGGWRQDLRPQAYIAISDKLYFYGFGPSQKVCPKYTIKVVLNCVKMVAARSGTI